MKYLYALFLINLFTCNEIPDVANWSIGHNASLDFSLSIFSPTVPGSYSIIIFFSGYDGLIPVFMYSQMITRLVNQSRHIVIGLDRLRYPSFPQKEEHLFEETLDWIVANLEGIFDCDETPKYIRGLVEPIIDNRGLTLMSHSAAGHPSCMYLTKMCGLFKKLVLIDPVDGYDPFGWIKLFCTNPPNQVPFQMPTLLIAHGLDPVPVNILHDGCAPNKVSNDRFYEAISGPIWYFNFTSYGHMDFLNDNWRILFGEKQCKSCAKVKESVCDFEVYSETLTKSIEIFIKGIDERNITLIDALSNPKNSSFFDKSISIESKFKLNEYNVTKTGAFCNHS